MDPVRIRIHFLADLVKIRWICMRMLTWIALFIVFSKKELVGFILIDKLGFQALGF